MIKRGRIVLLAGVLLALVLIAIVVAIVLPDRRGIPSGTQSALEAYLSYASSTRSQILTVDQVRKAAYPGRLNSSMSYDSLGDSAYYRTSISYTHDAPAGPMPLPYPPEQVWCALVVLGPGGATGDSQAARGVVFVALHQDIYNADWVVHEAAPDVFSERSFEVAGAIGCRLDR
jgi:hypothetical protein